MCLKQQVYLGLGSNLKNPSRQLATATKHISHLPNTVILNMAPWYKTAPWGVTDQPDFLNTVVVIRTALKPLQLLRHIKIIEYRLMARETKLKWHSRTIDIDILYYPKTPFKRHSLTLPHTHLTERCFVLRPLLDINPKQLPATVTHGYPTAKKRCPKLIKQKNALELNAIDRIISIQNR